MTKRVRFKVNELSAAYALKTLYDYVNTSNIDAEFYFNRNAYDDLPPRVTEILKNCPRISDADFVDLEVLIYADGNTTNTKTTNHTLKVDASILKNCAPPLEARVKNTIKKKYDIDGKKPIVVVGFADSSERSKKLISALQDHAEIYLVGSEAKHIKSNQSVKIVLEYGVLKDYFAVADLAMYGCNLMPSAGNLHNFVEATEGGPLFLYAPDNIKQYGYRELREKNVIRAYDSLAELLDAAKEFVQNFKDNKEHCANRAKHIQQSKALYLPVVAAEIERSLGFDVKVPSTKLVIRDAWFGSIITHPQTKW